MKPRELYSGAAPTAMGQMGAGILEAGANIGRSMQSGYEALGKGIASGITSAAASYSQYKQLDAESKSAEKMFNSLADENYLPKTVVERIRTQAEEMKGASALDRNAFWKDQKAMLGNAVGQSYQMEIAKQQGLNAINSNPNFALIEAHKGLLAAQADLAKAQANQKGTVANPMNAFEGAGPAPTPIRRSGTSGGVVPSATGLPAAGGGTGYYQAPANTSISDLKNPFAAPGTPVPTASVFSLNAPVGASDSLDTQQKLSLSPSGATPLIPELSEMEKGDQIKWNDLFSWEQDAIKKKMKSGKFGEAQWSIMHPETQKNIRADLQ